MGTLSLATRAGAIQMTPPPGFTELYERYSDLVYRTAYRVTGNPADAEDALQTVFIRVMNQGDRLDLAAMPEKYLRRAAANAAVDILRRRSSRAESQLDESLPHAAPEHPALLKERLRRALAQLNPGDASMFVLRYVEGLSNGEIGELFGLNRARVAVKLHRIRGLLKAELER
jgi:RNA polymerase sigma-70 factor (ECF subfamily)